jgi:hypothetical protein
MKVRKAELISITMLLRYPDTRPFAFASYAVLRLLNRLLQHVWAMTELFLPNLHVHVFNANVRKLSIFTLVSFLTFMLTTILAPLRGTRMVRKKRPSIVVIYNVAIARFPLPRSQKGCCPQHHPILRYLPLLQGRGACCSPHPPQAVCQTDVRWYFVATKKRPCLA